MKEIKIKLNEEETFLYKKWKTFSLFSIIFTMIYFIWLGFHTKEILESYYELILPMIFLLNATIFHFYSISYKKMFLKMINNNHGQKKKKHKLIELMEKREKELSFQKEEDI